MSPASHIVTPDVLEGLSLEEKAARLFWVSVHGPSATDPHPENRAAYGVDTPLEVIRRYRPGGVVLFAWADNTQHPMQVAQLARALRTAAAGDTGLPLAVAIDDEGGRISHLGPPATRFPSARALAVACGRAVTGDRIEEPDLAERRWRAGAAELAAVGVTVNFAPVADLGESENPVLGDRTFGDVPEIVAAHGACAVRGLHAGGIAAVAKHFPGHGATSADSHETLPVVELARAALDPHLEAFRRLLALEAPDALMTAHILVRALDEGVPATLSKAVLTGLLRGELGFDGAVITDSLSMDGIRERVADAEAPVAALAAGADVPLMPPDLPGAIESVCAAVRDGRLAEARLDEALRRALPLAGPLPDGEGASTPFGEASHRALAAEIATRALEVADPAGRLPLGTAPVVVVGVAGAGAGALAAALRDGGCEAALCEEPPADLVAHLADGSSPLVVVRRTPELDAAAQDALLEPLLREAAPSVALVETGTGSAPRHADGLTVVRTHCAGSQAIQAAADVLCGSAS